MTFDSNDPLRVEYLNGRLWKLLEDFSYFDEDFPPEGAFIDVPAGFVTDFASVPRIFWITLPPTGKYGKAAVIHDYLYQYGKVGQVRITRAYADGIFRKAMEELGVGKIRRNLMWAAVRIGAGGAWNRSRENGPRQA